MPSVDDLKQSLSEVESIMFKARWLVRETLALARGNLKNFGISEFTLNQLKKELKLWDSSKGKWKN